MRPPRGPLARALAAGVLVAACATAAQARAYDRGETVWFSTVVLGEGDDVRGNLDVVFGTVVCGDGAEVEGDVRTVFGTFEALEGCTVDGRVTQAFDGDSVAAAVPFLAARAPDAAGMRERDLLERLGWDVAVVLAFLLFPGRVRLALERVERRPALSAAAGAAVAIAAVPAGLVLLLSVVGIPIVPIEAAALLAALWIGQAAVAALIGRRLVESVRPALAVAPLATLLLGLVVVTAAQTLPVVGWAVTALVSLVGLGAAFLAFARDALLARAARHGVARRSA